MEVLENSIYPIFDCMLGREGKEVLLGQRDVTVWLTGLSGLGKSMITITLERELHKRGLLCRILGGDNIRSSISNNLGFSPEDRVGNIRRTVKVGRLLIDMGVITIVAFIDPNDELRGTVSAIIGKVDFLEVYTSASLAECERRDAKNLYVKARKDEIKEFTGVSVPLEAPERPDLPLDTSVLSVEQSVSRLLELIVPRVETEH